MTIPSTLNLHDAVRREWDVIAIGAGPAGSMAARELARRGLKVLLVDRAEFPRWKVCGSCVNLCAQATLKSVGLGDLLEEHRAVAIAGVRLSAQGRHALVAMPGERVLSREAFDAALVTSAVTAGAHFLPRAEAHFESTSPECCQIKIRRDEQDAIMRAKVVVAADGLSGGFRRHSDRWRSRPATAGRIGAGAIGSEFPSFYDAPNIFMACGAGGYVGLVRVEDGRLNIGAAFDPEFVRREGGLPQAASAILRQAGLPAIARLADFPWRGTPLLTRSVSPPATERVFLLGDAASYVEPFTGEGIAWALASGVAVAPLAERACQQWRPGLVREWAERHRQIVTRRQWLCRTVAQVLRRPWLTRSAIMILAQAPGLAAPLLRYLNK